MNKFIKENLEIIKKYFKSSYMAWDIDSKELPECYYIIEQDTELIVLNLKDSGEFFVGMPIAYKENEWKLMELNQDKSNEQIKIGDLRCLTCEDFDLCIKCNEIHEHELEPVYQGSWGINTYDLPKTL